MKRRTWIAGFISALLVSGAAAVEDPGREKLGLVRVTVYFATDGDPKVAGAKVLPVEESVVKRIRSEERLRFKHYRLLGRDTQPLLRSYESWAEPLKPSDEVMVRFEAQGVPEKNSAVLDLELWLARKKIVKTNAHLQEGKPLFMLGPEWRSGRLIIVVALATDGKTES
jgi:hypothetical protein